MPVLIIETGPNKGHTVPLQDEQVYAIGRDERANVRLDDELASRIHARIRGKEGRFFIKDNDSSNGTFVNDTRIDTTVELKSGDRIGVGDTTFSFLAEAEAGGAAGRVLGGYQLIKRLGRGGMGTVYRAMQLSLNREVALKILSPELSRDPAFVDRFHKEARAAGQLNHPNIVQVYDVNQEGGLTFYAMEYMTGGTVEDLLNKQGPLDLANAVRLLADAARGLQYAEMKKIIHRDIKPDNLMLTEIGSLKIADLGLAHAAHEKDDTGHILGTPHFISPEQARGQPLDTRSDMYSLGATFFRMLTGKTMFHGENAEDIVRKQLKEAPPTVRELRPDVPEAIAAIQARLVQKEPTARYQTVAELLLDIERSSAGKRGRGVLVTSLLLLTLAISAAAFVFSRQRRDDNREPVSPIIIDRTDPEAEAERQRMAQELERGQREMEALRAFTDLRDQQAGLDKAEYLTRMEELLARYGGSAAASEQAPAIEALRAELAETQRLAAEAQAKVDHALRVLVEQVDAALGTHAFAAAAGALTGRGGIEPSLADSRPLTDALAAQSARIQDAATREVTARLELARAAADRQDYETGRREVAAALAMVSDSDALPHELGPLKQQLLALARDAAELEHQLEDAADSRRRALLAADLTLLRTSFDWPAFHGSLQHYQFGTARDALAGMRDGLQTDAYRAFLDRQLADVSGAATAFATFLAALEGGTLVDKALQHPEREGQVDLYGPADNRDGVVVEIVRSVGSSRAVLGFQEFNSADKCLDLLSGRFAAGPAERIDIALCALLVARAAWHTASMQVAAQLAAYDANSGWSSGQCAALAPLAPAGLPTARLATLLEPALADPATAERAAALSRRIDRENEALQLFLRGLAPFRGDTGEVHFAGAAELLTRFRDSYRDSDAFLAAYALFDDGRATLPLIRSLP